MTPSMEQAVAEARKLEQEITRAFGMSPTARFSVKPTGIQFVQTDGRIWWFGMHGWSAHQQQAVEGLYKHFPGRAIMSLPQQWEQR